MHQILKLDKMKRAIILVRVSTDRQTTDSQRDEMIKFAQGNGYQLDECHLIERHESATKKEESQVVMELKDVIQNGGIEVVFTFELSRLSRRVEYLEDIKNLFIKYNIKLICKIEGVFNFNENTDLSQLIIFDVFKNLCQQEGIIRKERFARGKKAMFENNLYTGGKILYGYSVVNKNFVVNEAEAKVVRMIFD
ncbi:MAG: recombinase family protein, partial [Tannerella sp.]|nr:recombinase family protein [Tannerella sp.]